MQRTFILWGITIVVGLCIGLFVHRETFARSVKLLISGFAFAIVAVLLGAVIGYSSKTLFGMLTLSWPDAGDAIGLNKAVVLGYSFIIGGVILVIRKLLWQKE